ncbi:MAG: protein-L-isoaspartate(D-aspartate) O-methyltransferase [Candidatus Nanoarchaeia archaeon]
MLAQRRLSMIRELEIEGIKDKKVLQAMEKIPRHEFVPKELQEDAYANIPLPVGQGQTISQPYTVAFMLEALELKEGQKVLEIGAASGYNACLIAEIVGKKGKVYTIEIIPELVKLAKENIKRIGIRNIRVIYGDGSKGYAKAKPYDRIIITAGAPEVPKPLIKQLKNNGILVGPIGQMYSQNMIKITKTRKGITKKDLGYFVFVPLKGKYGHK